MINATTQAGFTEKDNGLSLATIWATLEQEYNVDADSNYASMYDVYQMVAFGKVGMSSLDYLIESCKYAYVLDDTLLIDLEVYVWPSYLALDYNLTAAIGVVGPGKQKIISKSFNTIFDNSKVEVLPYVLDGTATAQTPFIDNDGSILDNMTPQIEGSVISIPDPAFVVLLVGGDATCYSHTITMSFSLQELIDEDMAITGIHNAITLSYLDENGDTQTVIETLDIPPCVQQILEFCGKELIWNISAGRTGRNNSIEVYYSTCDGEALKIREVDSTGKTVGSTSV